MAVLGWKQLEVSEKNELPEVAGAGRQGSPQLQAFGVSGEAAAWGLWGSVFLDSVSLSNRGSRCPRAVARCEALPKQLYPHAKRLLMVVLMVEVMLAAGMVVIK